MTWSVTFTGSLVRGDVGQLEIIDKGINGCNAGGDFANTVESRVDVRDARLPVYRLETTPMLPYNVGAQEMKDALEGLNRVARVDVSKSVENNGFSWMVTFRGFDDRSSSDMPVMLVNSVGVSAAVDGKTTATSVTEHVVSGLTTGDAHYFDVAAVNSFGKGASTTSNPVSKQPIAMVPGVVQNLRASVGADRMINVQFDEPTNNGGEGISHYRVQYDTTSTFDSTDFLPFEDISVVSSNNKRRPDVQMVTVVSELDYFPAGTFVLNFLGQNTPELDFNITASGMKSALESLSTIETVTVSRELFCTNDAGVNNCGPRDRGYVWMVTFNEVIENGIQTEPYISSYDTFYNQRLSVTGDFLVGCDGTDKNLGNYYTTNHDSSTPGKFNYCYVDKTVAFVDNYPEIQSVCLCDNIPNYTIGESDTYMGQSAVAQSDVDRSVGAKNLKDALESITGVGHVTVTTMYPEPASGSCGCGVGICIS